MALAAGWPRLICAAAALRAAGCVKPATNPFKGQTFYVNPVNAKEFDSSIKTAEGKTKENLLRMQKVPSAYWIDVKAKVHGDSTESLEGILKDAASKSPPELVVVIWYDLPNRDCDAKASNGQICCYKNTDGTCNYEKTGDCKEGLKEYFEEYADPFIQVLQQYESKLPIVVVVEPDSLPNIATNSGHSHCGNKATQTAYREGIKYALVQLTTKVPKVAVYLDAAHGGWLGWEDNLEKFVGVLKEDKYPMDKIRGFALNVANYQPLGIQCPFCPDQGYRNAFCLNGHNKDHPCCADPCDLEGQYDAGNNEMNTAAGLVAAAKGMLGMEAHVIIDTGRNGVEDMRKDCKNWCNPRNAGAGVPATTDTANTSMVDAYFWLKTPGESDGCSEMLPDGSRCPRFDFMCASSDSIGTSNEEPRAPEAGGWFDYQVKQLALNANFEIPVYDEKKAKGAKGNASNKTGNKSSLGSLKGDVCGSITQGGGNGGGSSIASNMQMVAPKHKSNGSCADVFQQCGGLSGGGPGCCEEGCTCTGDKHYKQCTPPSGLWTCRPLVAVPVAADNQSSAKQSSAGHSSANQGATKGPAASPAVQNTGGQDAEASANASSSSPGGKSSAQLANPIVTVEMPSHTAASGAAGGGGELAAATVNMLLVAVAFMVGGAVVASRRRARATRHAAAYNHVGSPPEVA